MGEEQVDESGGNLRLGGRRSLEERRFSQRVFGRFGGEHPQRRHLLNGFASAFEGGLRRVVGIQAGRVAHRREDGGFGGGQFGGGFAEVELRGGFGSEGVATEVGRVEGPFEDLGAPVERGDLRGKDAFPQGAAQAGGLVPEQEVEDEFLRDGGVQLVTRNLIEGIAGVGPETGVGGGDDGVCQRFGQVLGVALAERDVAARLGGARGGGKGEEDVFARAVKDLRGLEHQPIRRVEQGGEQLRGGQVACQVHVGKGGGNDERGEQ